MKDFKHLEPKDYLRIPFRRRWYFLATAVLVIGCVSGFAWMRQNVYRSETRILVESATLLDDPMSPGASRDRTEDRVNAIRQLLESRSILEQIVEDFRLRQSDASIPMEDALRFLRNNLEVSKASGSVFTMSYYSTDPLVAQAVMRRLAEILIRANQNSLKTKADEKDQFLEQELRQAEQELDAVDEKITQFKAKHLGELPEQGTAIMNALNGLHSQLVAVENTLDRARDEQKNLQFRLEEQKRLSALAKTLVAKESPPPADSVAKEAPSPLAAQLTARQAQLTEWTARYTAKHPDVIRLSKEIADLERQIKEKDATARTSSEATQTSPGKNEPSPASTKGQGNAQLELTAEAAIAQAQFELGGLADAISKREKERENILKNIEAYQKRLNLAPGLEEELAALTHEHESKRIQVEGLQTRKFNSQMVANAVRNKNNDVYSILDEASLPERPIFPSRFQVMLMGIGVGLVAGVAGAFAREYFEPSIANEEEALALLKIPILVSIPEISKRPRALHS